MRTAIIVISIVIVVIIGSVIFLTVWHNRECANKIERTVELEATVRDEAIKRLPPGAFESEQEKIYASPEFEQVISRYEEIARECKNESVRATASLERLKKAKQKAEEIIKQEEEEKKIAQALGIEYIYLKKFPEGIRLSYFYGESNQEDIDFSEYTCKKYSDSLHGEYQDIFMIEIKTPLKDGPADYFSRMTLIIPKGLEKNKYAAVGNIGKTDSPTKSSIYLKFYLPEYINYKDKKIFFKMNDLVSDSGNIVILDPLDSEEGDNVKLLGRNILVNKMPDGSAGGRVSLEINIVCHTVQQ